MAEKLISCNWVDPRRMRQAQQWCWLGMGHQCLSRTGALVSAGTGPMEGLCSCTQLGRFTGAGACAARLVCEVTWGPCVVFPVLMVPLPNTPPALRALRGTLGSQTRVRSSSPSQDLFIPSLGEILLKGQRACRTHSQPRQNGPESPSWPQGRRRRPAQRAPSPLPRGRAGQGRGALLRGFGFVRGVSSCRG